MELNEEQKVAVEHMEGPCLVIAPPGSGKTRVITERAVRLIEKGVKPDRMLCITFTNKAANEMKQRICARLNVKKSPFFIGTFHSFCVQILRNFGHHIGYKGNFTIADSNDQKDLINQIARKQGYSKFENKDVWVIVDAVNKYREQLENQSELEERVGSDHLLSIAEAYLKYLLDNNILDFSGLLSEAVRLLNTHKEVLDRVQSRFDMVQIDESQDTNLAQFAIAELITDKSHNLFFVADVNQAIYGWRGARPQNIQDYLDRHPDCKVVSLKINYRSTPEIIDTAINLINHNTGRLTKFGTINASGKGVNCQIVRNQFEEAQWIAKKVKELIGKGCKPSEIAILYRVNRMSEPIERALVEKGISYDVIGSRSFYDRKEIRDCLAMLKLLANPKDGIAFSRVATLVSGVGNVTVGKIENLVSSDVDIFDACSLTIKDTNSVKIKSGLESILGAYKGIDKSTPVSDIAADLVSSFSYHQHLEVHDEETAVDRSENVKQLIESAANFNGTDNNIERYLQSVSLITSGDKENNEKNVCLITGHSCKGLEHLVVFCISLEEGILPHALSIRDNPEEGVQEERRLAYVCFTRAKELLFVSYCKERKFFTRNGGSFSKPVRPSRFLYEAGLLK
tara:strand:- start:2837 stop:4714 length:1878 start_codon:yes stop_codon:yes gene_type:complete